MSDVSSNGRPGAAVDKALSVLEALVESAPMASLGTIADKAGLIKSTTHAILRVLVHRGYARSDAAGSYGPGTQTLALAGQVIETLDWAGYARPFLVRLQELVPETVHFGVMFGSDLIYVDKLEARGAFRMTSTIGMRLPMHSTAIGKAVLAQLPDERDGLLARGLARRTPNTIVDRLRLDEALLEVARVGVAYDDEENEEEVRCIAAPVFGPAGRVIGGISISGPAFRLTDDRLRGIAPAVMSAAYDVSRSLGAPAAALDGWWQRQEAPRGAEGPFEVRSIVPEVKA